MHAETNEFTSQDFSPTLTCSDLHVGRHVQIAHATLWRNPKPWPSWPCRSPWSKGWHKQGLNQKMYTLIKAQIRTSSGPTDTTGLRVGASVDQGLQFFPGHARATFFMSV